MAGQHLPRRSDNVITVSEYLQKVNTVSIGKIKIKTTGAIAIPVFVCQPGRQGPRWSGCALFLSDHQTDG